MVRYLYIHIPFCLKKCIYCDFYSVSDSAALIEDYVEALCKEIDMRKGDIDVLDAIYIGGGTPSMLAGKDVSTIMNKLRSACSISSEAEITSEANPGTLTERGIKHMHDSGINRISIGVQSLNDTELSLLGRMHNSAGAMKSFSDARQSGFKNISVDLMYGIPGQDIESWERTLKVVIGLHPEHISAYELTPEKNTPLYERLEAGALRLPDEEAVVEMYDSALDTLAGSGYLHYEISNYALPRYECRHNLNYWNRGAYAGIGAGAHSFSAARRTANVSDIKRYIAAINEDRLPIVDEKALTEDDGLNELLFLGLRKTEGLDLAEIPAKVAEELKRASEECSLQGLIQLSGSHLRLTRKGLLFCNEVIVRLMLDIERRRSAQ